MPEKSIVLEKTEDIIPKPEYSAEEEEYMGRLRAFLSSSRDMRDQAHDEFDGMDYLTQYESNERLANTFIAPKKNKEDTHFQSGVVRQKLFALLAALVNLNLTGDVSAFDQEDLKLQALGNAMEDIILKTNELDTDDEKKYLRQYELLKHGTVFVEELWDDKLKKEKKLKSKWDGKIKGVDWTERIKKAFARPTRNIIPGINVYLGDITKYDIADQPRVFTVDTVPYQEAKMMFGEWERWKNVPKKLNKFDDTKSNIVKDWTLLQTKDNFVEIVRIQDKWNNEFTILLNGMLMTPIGLPLPWGYDDYNIAQQNLEPINAKFAYGKSLVSRLRNKVGLFDELLRVAVLKTQQSFKVPSINISGRIVSNRIFMPGVISHGIAPGTILPLNDQIGKGVTQSEFSMIKEIQESINNETVSPTFQGQQSGGDPTATEIIELQRQAKMVLGLTIFSVSMLEWKLEWLRLKNILANWFEEEDQIVDEVRGVLKDKYRSVGVDRQVDGEGMGRRIVIPTKKIPSGPAIMQAEQALTQEQGVPVRLIFLDPDEVCSSKLVWQIVVRPKEKTTSEMQKLMFRAFLQDAQMFGPMLNLNYLAEEFATTWQKDPSKVLKSKDQQQIDQMQQVQADQQPGSPTGGKPVSPRVNLPSPESAMGRNVKQQLQVSP